MEYESLMNSLDVILKGTLRCHPSRPSFVSCLALWERISLSSADCQGLILCPLPRQVPRVL